MGEASLRSRSRAAILVSGPRCIYCSKLATFVEHMPPKSMFIDERRPSGMEFPACKECNEGTTGADLVASFYARISQSRSADPRLIQEAAERRNKMRKLVPGVLEELLNPVKLGASWTP